MQLENLSQERALLAQAANNDIPKEDEPSARSAQSNTKQKRALQSVKDKIQRVVSDRPELFEGVGEDTNDRLDHLISTLVDQAAQKDSERMTLEEKIARQSQELQDLKQTNESLNSQLRGHM